MSEHSEKMFDSDERKRQIGRKKEKQDLYGKNAQNWASSDSRNTTVGLVTQPFIQIFKQKTVQSKAGLVSVIISLGEFVGGAKIYNCFNLIEKKPWKIC